MDDRLNSRSPAGQQASRPLLDLGLSLAVLIVLLMACASHAARHLNLTGDEVYFYFLGMKDRWSDYRPHYEAVRAQFRALDLDQNREQLSDAQLGNIDDAEFYLGIEPQYFTEYTIPRLLWGTVSGIVAPTSDLAQSDQALSQGSADSVFFMVAAGYLLVTLFVAGTTYRLTAATKVALVLFTVITFVKESFVSVDIEFFYRVFSPPAAAFLATPVWENKDLMVFGFSSRSLLLMLLVAYLANRWEALYRAPSPAAGFYVILPVATLVHMTQGVLLAGMFLALDALLGRHRLRHPLVLFSYAAAFGFAMHGGLAAGPWAFGGLGLLTLLLLGAAAFASGRKQPVLDVSGEWSARTLRRVTGWAREILLCGLFALGFLLLAHPVGTALGLEGRSYSWLVILAMRLSSMFTALGLFAASWLIVETGSRILNRKVIGTLPLAGLAVVWGPIAIWSGVVLTDLNFDLFQVRERLRLQSASYLERTAMPISFRDTNERHIIWYSIIKSAIHGRSYVVQLDLTE